MFVIVMTSGYMWVRIRSAPYAAAGRDGKMQSIAASLQNQLGVETHMIALLNGSAALAMIALSSVAPAISHGLARRMAVFACMAVIMVTFSAEVAIFRRKMGGYPFRLLFA